jgi:hypothetical protein
LIRRSPRDRSASARQLPEYPMADSPSATKPGSGAKYTTDDGVRAIRDGIRPHRGSGQEDAAPKPPWLRVRAPGGGRFEEVRDIVRSHGLHTVCAESKCPNIGECWGRGTATFMVLGDVCTRACRFCSVATGNPNQRLDPAEPLKVARAVELMGLRYVVLTSVDRDDLADGGAAHYAACIRAIHTRVPQASVEALTPDFAGVHQHVATVLDAGLVTFAQNALAPAKINRVAVREEPILVTMIDEHGNDILDESGEPVTRDSRETVLDVIVGSEQLSLAIGKRGQNVRLASKMLGCRIEIKSEEAVKDELASALASMLREMEGVTEEEEMPQVGAASEAVDYSELIPLEELDMLTDRLRERLQSHGLHTVQDVLARDADGLSTIPGIGPVTAQKLLDMSRRALQVALAEAVDAQAGEE